MNMKRWSLWMLVVKLYETDKDVGSENSNGQIFEREVMPLIPSIINGSNATVFAYGATSSGKTFTMQTKRFNNSKNKSNDSATKNAMDLTRRWPERVHTSGGSRGLKSGYAAGGGWKAIRRVANDRICSGGRGRRKFEESN
ncbi:hypothetical protein L6452_39054 [Arctium lappa]|uniref:Uncharacterized protein n=1 Tax=Arctium lappa TaxID=4217 RepID=A0ACB8XS56_ARCLA|nr:hypothetical protein L6452_39054 [Arctium lappa]